MDIAVIGLGLIGGSLLQALATGGHELWGFDTDPAVRATARTAAAQAPPHARWQVAADLRDAAVRADLVIIAVPFPAVDEVLHGLASAGYTGLVTDVVSVKGPVRDMVAQRLLGGHWRLAGYIGGHPMAGRETSGFAAADPSLFTGAPWVLCLEQDTSLTDWLVLADLVTRLGARVVPTTAAEHDRAVATVSHVPHLVAAALARAAAGDPLALTLAAGSFRDGTRVAATPPALTAAMCGGNAAAVGEALAGVTRCLQDAADALGSDHPVHALRPWLAPAAQVRAAWPPRAGARFELPARPDTLLALGREGGWVVAVTADRRTVLAARPLGPPAAAAPR